MFHYIRGDDKFRRSFVRFMKSLREFGVPLNEADNNRQTVLDSISFYDCIDNFSGSIDYAPKNDRSRGPNSPRTLTGNQNLQVVLNWAG